MEKHKFVVDVMESNLPSKSRHVAHVLWWSDVALTQQTLANCTGLNPGTVSRALAPLTEGKWVVAMKNDGEHATHYAANDGRAIAETRNEPTSSNAKTDLKQAPQPRSQTSRSKAKSTAKPKSKTKAKEKVKSIVTTSNESSNGRAHNAKVRKSRGGSASADAIEPPDVRWKRRKAAQTDPQGRGDVADAAGDSETAGRLLDDYSGSQEQIDEIAAVAREAGIAATKAKQAAFAAFWNRYPKRNGIRAHKAAALKAWMGMSDSARTEAEAGLAQYATAMDGFPADAVRYLSHQLWNDYDFDPAARTNGHRKRADVSDEWSAEERGLVDTW